MSAPILPPVERGMAGEPAQCRWGRHTEASWRVVLPDLRPQSGRAGVGSRGGGRGLGGVGIDIARLLVSPPSLRAMQTNIKSQSWTSSGA